MGIYHRHDAASQAPDTLSRARSCRRVPTQYSSGFTIIEVVLVLAITGMMIAGILIGSGVAINRQRYNDSINSLEALLQDQYSETANVVNDPRSTSQCNPALTNLDACRGKSNTVVNGKVITITHPTGLQSTSQITISNVLTQVKTPATFATSAIDDLTANSISVQAATTDTETSETSWGTVVVDKGATATPIDIRILIVRAPTVGSTLTFVEKKTPPSTLSSNLFTIIKPENTNVTTDMCLDPNGLVLVGSKRAVRINPYAATATSIEIPIESSNVCA